MTGLVIDGASFEVLNGKARLGDRRPIERADVEFLAGLASRYTRAVQARSDAGVLIELGRELYRRLDGDQGQLSRLLEVAEHPLVFEVEGPRSPAEAAWAMLRAPFELLANPRWRAPGRGRGDYDEVLRIRRDIELPVHERLGDIRETAVTWGKIADIAHQRRDYDEAALLRLKELGSTGQLGRKAGQNNPHCATPAWRLA
jgi:hypothetical protein